MNTCTEDFCSRDKSSLCVNTVTACFVGTMDVINRLKSAVTNVLPVGNPITTEFDILDQRASGGPALLWKVYDGVQRSTKQACFVFCLTFLRLHLLCITSVDPFISNTHSTCLQ